MSAQAVVNAVLALVTTAVAGDQPIQVVLGPPRAFHDDRLIYLYHDGSIDLVKAGASPSVIRRTHIIPIHAMLLTTADDSQTEKDLLTVHDQLTGLFYTNHRISGTCVASTLKQRDGSVGGASAQMYMMAGGKEYRHRFWTLEAIEELSFTMA